MFNSLKAFLRFCASLFNLSGDKSLNLPCAVANLLLFLLIFPVAKLIATPTELALANLGVFNDLTLALTLAILVFVFGLSLVLVIVCCLPDLLAASFKFDLTFNLDSTSLLSLIISSLDNLDFVFNFLGLTCC